MGGEGRKLADAVDAEMSEFSRDFLPILDQFKVPDHFRQFLLTNECNSVHAFVAATSDPTLFDNHVLEACGLDLTFGAKLAAWRAFIACAL